MRLSVVVSKLLFAASLLLCCSFDGCENIARTNRPGDVAAERLMMLAHAEQWGLFSTRLEAYQGDVNIVDRYGQSLLIHAAYQDDPNLVEMLIQKGADVSHRDGGGKTALHAAAWNNRVQNSRVLIDSGADVEIRTADGHTPLFIAAICGSEDVVTCLLENGADPNAIDNAGWTPLLYMLQSERGEKPSARVVEELLKHGADPNYANRQSGFVNTPNGRVESVPGGETALTLPGEESTTISSIF